MTPLVGGGGGDTFVFGHGYGADHVNAYINYVTWDYPMPSNLRPM